MYRQWRECTKAMISGKTPRIRKHEKITEEYLLYARKRLASESGLAKSYNQNHGIIALRDDFLKEINMKGSDIIRQEYATTGGAPEDVSKDVILVPIATIGCGKTTIALALAHLFNWGHVQNDNITGKGRPPRFTKEVLDLLKEAPVVYADRNNAQKIVEDCGDDIELTKGITNARSRKSRALCASSSSRCVGSSRGAIASSRSSHSPAKSPLSYCSVLAATTALHAALACDASSRGAILSNRNRP